MSADNYQDRHQDLHKRQVVTDVEYVTAQVPDVVVYVDENGNILYTSYMSNSPVTPVTSAVVVASAKAQTTLQTSTSAAAAASTAAASAKSSSSSSSSSSNGGLGVSYSPYSGSYQAGNVACKTTAEVATDFESLVDFSTVRIYGTDCNQVANVLAAASSKSMSIFAGVYDITQVEAEIAIIVAAANGDWSSFHTISIGNELVNDGVATVAQVTAAISTARTLLTAAGYTGNVVTVDTFVAVKEYPALCLASDFAAVNAHPFFDGTITAAQAGAWVLKEMEAVSAACGGKTTWVTETGWPTAGEANGVAVPSTANQKTALSSIKSSVSSNIVLFTAFNDMWKAPGYLAVEQSWGFL